MLAHPRTGAFGSVNVAIPTGVCFGPVRCHDWDRRENEGVPYLDCNLTRVAKGTK